MTSKKKFDVFLSHNSKDKPWVVTLKGSLEALGVKVWLDKDEIRPGDLFAKALERGIGESRAVALVISPEAMASGWVEAEYYRALNLATNHQLQLIPVLYKKAEIPGFLSDRNWVDFGEEDKYDEKVGELVWGITGKKSRTKKSPHKSEGKSSKKRVQSSREITQLINQIRNPFVRDLERKLRMSNAHWIQAGFPVPEGETNFALVYYQNQIEVFKRIEATTEALSADIAHGKANLLQDSFLDRLEENLNQVIRRLQQVDELLSLSRKEFELSLVLRKAGKVIRRDVEKVRKIAHYAPTRLLSNPREYDRVSNSLSTELGNLAISIEEYQKYLSGILNQARLEKIYLSSDSF